MCTINLSLPETLKVFVDQQIAAGRYGSVNAYILDLILEDAKRQARLRRDALLLEGLESPESELTRQDFADIRQEALALVKDRENRTRGRSGPSAAAPSSM